MEDLIAKARGAVIEAMLKPYDAKKCASARKALSELAASWDITIDQAYVRLTNG